MFTGIEKKREGGTRNVEREREPNGLQSKHHALDTDTIRN